MTSSPVSRKNQIIRYLPLILILSAAAFLFTFRLNRDLLWDWDECVYAQFAKEMGASHQYLANSWNGYTDLQKPPLYTWLLQIPLLFGSSEFQFRILSVICCLILISAVYLYSNRCFNQPVAIFASLFLLASESILVYTTRANTDIFLTMFIFLSFCFWSFSAEKPRWSYLSGALLGFGCLVKGLTPLLYLFPIFVCTLIRFRREKGIRFLKILIAFLIVVLPWHILVFNQYGNEFVSNYFLDNILRRSFQAIDFHHSNWFVYFIQFYRELFPWIFLGFIFPVFALLGGGLSKPEGEKKAAEDERWLQIVLMILIPFAVITLIKTRVAWYALPIYPFLAIYLGGNAVALLEKLQLKKGYFLLLIPVMLDAAQLLIRGNAILQPSREIPPRYAAILASSRFPEPELHYLVPKELRDSLNKLPLNEQIPQTWIYGGNPCAVYYSRKNVRFYYVLEEFAKRMEQGKGLFMIQNDDLKLLTTIPARPVFKNDQYTLMEH